MSSKRGTKLGDYSVRRDGLAIALADYFWDDYMSPEERLLVGIFSRSLKDTLCPETCLPQHFKRSAVRYFRNLDPDEYGSFGHFCLYFDLEAMEVRRKILTDDMKQVLIATRRVMER